MSEKFSRRHFGRVAAGGLIAAAALFSSEKSTFAQKTDFIRPPIERDPISFPQYEIPSFKSIWHIIDRIGYSVGLDPRLLLAYTATETKHKMLSGMNGGSVGALQLNQALARSWFQSMSHEPLFPQVVDQLRPVGVDIADADYKPYPVVVNRRELIKSGENNLFAFPELVIGSYKILRDFVSGIPNITDEDRAFLAYIPDDPYTHQTYKKLVSRGVLSQIVRWFHGHQNSVYTAAVLGHIAPFAKGNPSKLADALTAFYTSTEIQARNVSGLDDDITLSLMGQQKLSDAQKKWKESLPEGHPSKHAPDIVVPPPEVPIGEWKAIRRHYGLLK